MLLGLSMLSRALPQLAGLLKASDLSTGQMEHLTEAAAGVDVTRCRFHAMAGRRDSRR